MMKYPILTLLCLIANLSIGLCQDGGTIAFLPSLSSSEPSPKLLTTLTRSNSAVMSLAFGSVMTVWAHRYDQRGLSAAKGGGIWETDIIDVGDIYGDGLYVGILSAVTWAAGATIGPKSLQQTGKLLLIGVTLNGAAVNAIKLTSGRLRPDGSDARSFPSGHASTAFTASTILARRHGWWVGVPAYAAAGLTALSRMEDNTHFASDVVAGACLGLLVGKILPLTRDTPGTALRPYAAISGAGVRFEF